MRCPFCRYPDSRVVDSREVEDGQAIRRRRSCPECSRRFTTLEGSLLSVVKRSGVTEPFSRSKVIAGVSRACQGRPVDPDAVAQLAQLVEETVRGSGQAEVQSQDVGLAILGPLRDLDEVAYLRFASVYRSFSSAEDFAAEIRDMRSRAGGRARETETAPADFGSAASAVRSDSPTSLSARSATTPPTAPASTTDLRASAEHPPPNVHPPPIGVW
jgi:transcriptional repressor NrdR